MQDRTAPKNVIAKIRLSSDGWDSPAVSGLGEANYTAEQDESAHGASHEKLQKHATVDLRRRKFDCVSEISKEWDCKHKS